MAAEVTAVGAMTVDAGKTTLRFENTRTTAHFGKRGWSATCREQQMGAGRITNVEGADVSISPGPSRGVLYSSSNHRPPVKTIALTTPLQDVSRAYDLKNNANWPYIQAVERIHHQGASISSGFIYSCSSMSQGHLLSFLR